MKHLFLDFDRTLFNTELFYNSLESAYIEGMVTCEPGINFKRFLYDDVLSFMCNCQNAGIICHLVTFGRRSIQEFKFCQSGLETYFDQKFYVEQGSKAEIIDNYIKTLVSCEKVIFVDDTISHLEEFSKVIHAGLPIRMSRLGAKGSEKGDARFNTIVDLDVLFAWLK